VRDPHPLMRDAVGEIETEGFAIMAKDMGIECWGLPDLEILHAKD
jgi:peptide chain release factor subunit 1